MTKDEEKTTVWDHALAVAEYPATDAWQQSLADALEAALRPDAVGVFLCRLGNLLEATNAVAPRLHAGLGERLLGEFLPSMHAAGIETPWLLFNDDGHDDGHGRELRLELEAGLLAPAGFTRLLGSFLRSRDGMVAGFIAVFSRSATHDRRAELLAALKPVARAAESAIQRSIDIASAVGARFPKISPYPLSGRELEVARLAASGFSDLNIARSLEISEGTVGRHLHNIYRKLGVGSRVELMDSLCPQN